jgi:hypothetical protein
MKIVLIGIWVMFAFEGLTAQTTIWQPSPWLATIGMISQ